MDEDGKVTDQTEYRVDIEALSGAVVNDTGSSASLLQDSVQDIPEASAHFSITTVLNYCKRKILRPYQKCLGLVGLRSLLDESHLPTSWCKFVNVSYLTLSITLITLGYVLQYMACFRRDRGFCYAKKNPTLSAELIHEETCENSFVFSFLIPSALHLAGYLHSVYTTRSSDDEQIPVLMERVFILSTYFSTSLPGHKKLVQTLWLFVVLSMVWMVSSFVLVNYMMSEGDFYFKWLKTSPTGLVNFLKVLLVVSTLWQDIVQATIISNYCLQAQLLKSYANLLRDRIVQCSVLPLEWMREIEEFKKLLNHFNDRTSPSVCMLNIVNVTFTCSGLLWLLKFQQEDQGGTELFALGFINVILWLLISVSPFIQAARLTNSCERLKLVGQEARTRPYVHLDTPTFELDSVLLYTTSLKINAKLYYTPITGKKLAITGAIITIALLVMGQCHFLNFNGFGFYIANSR